jgi:y4mF family transcriptional regulator
MQKDIFMDSLAQFVKARRKATGLTQEAFAQRAGVALTVVRKIEQGKTNLNLDRVGQVLSMFGHELGIKETDKFIPYLYCRFRQSV